MKLFRFGKPGDEKPGVIIDDLPYDMSRWIGDYDEGFFRNNGLDRLNELIAHHLQLPLVGENERIGSPIARPSKIICIGLNYSDHAQESNMPIPSEPVIFFKSTTAITGPYDELIIPKDSAKTDWEVELAVVIGKEASHVKEHAAMNHVAGYMLHNDYSERSFQLERGGQWVKGKSCDSFAPLGPWLVTKNEVPDVHNLRLWSEVNGKIMQDGNTANMIFSIPYLIHYLSCFMTLLPGDIISTGTPAGVGLGQKPMPIFLQPGDIITSGIEGLGSGTQVARAFREQKTIAYEKSLDAL